MSDEMTVAGMLDELVHAAAEASETQWSRSVLATAVAELEHAAGASLGAAESDSFVLLHRRLGRAHGLLTAAPGAATCDMVRRHLQALGGPARTSAPAPADDRSRLALAHAC